MSSAGSTRIRHRADMGLLLAVGMLVALGIGMVYSASFVIAHNEYGDDTYFLARHLVWVTIGIVAMVTTSRLDYHLWQRFAAPIFFISLALLALVLVPGLATSEYGASRWFRIGSFLSLQPSELAKLAIVIYLAAWMTRVGDDIGGFTFGTIPFVIIISITAGLVLIEPDLGTTIVIVATAASMFFMAGANILHALLGGLVGCLFLLKFVIAGSAYKADRMEAFLDPWADPGGIGWHTTQTLVALGSGGLAGLGLGASRGKYNYVPNPHTDSIFAVIGEEIGFIGTMLVLVIFLYIAWRGLSIAFSTRDPFGRALVVGATLVISWQALLNMAVVSHVVPNTGVPLPFVSFGGSSMVVSLAAIGMILCVSRESTDEDRSLRNLLTGGGERGEESGPGFSWRALWPSFRRTSSATSQKREASALRLAAGDAPPRAARPARVRKLRPQRAGAKLREGPLTGVAGRSVSPPLEVTSSSRAGTRGGGSGRPTAGATGSRTMGEGRSHRRAAPAPGR
ncbi:MAG: cell division protein FtsW [Chloroflexota bacterium]|jgi:cell division protein FtsW|nr:cell division protein FtsW [Chloroflexota bacterium]